MKSVDKRVSSSFRAWEWPLHDWITASGLPLANKLYIYYLTQRELEEL